MSLKGADYAWDRPSIDALQDAGIKFVCRYLSRDPAKNLTAAETRALLAAGIAVVVVWEWDAYDMLRGYEGGVIDAQSAELQADACGLRGIPIYFACDYDAPEAAQRTINNYLDGAAAVLGRARVGMYGGYWPLSRARAAARATYWWGTVAWSGDNWATCGWRPHIMQGPKVTIGGADCDLDAANYTDYGQWPRPKETDVPLTGDDAKALWLADGIVWAPTDAPDYATNKYWTPARHLAELTRDVRALQAKVDQILAALQPPA